MKIKIYSIEIFIFTFLSFLLIYSSEPVMYPDSTRIITGSLRDPPLYHNLINIIKFIFGNLKFVVIFQTIVIGLGINYLIIYLDKYFNLENHLKIILTLFLLLPVVTFYNHILTEPLGYGLSLILFSFVLKLIYEYSDQNLVGISIFVILLVLLRNQFIILYPVFFLFYLGIFVIEKSRKTLIKLVISFICIFLFQQSATKIDNYIKIKTLKNDQYIKLLNKKSPIRFISNDAIYISEIKDIELFENKNLREALFEIFTEMEKQKALSKYYDSRGHFALSFKIIDDFSENILIDLAKKEKVTIENIRKEYSIILIKNNFLSYIKLIFKKSYDSTWLFVIVPLFIFLAALISFFKKKSKFSLLSIFLSTFVLTNHSVVYLFGRVQPRYFIYTDLILLVFIFISFSILLKKTN